MGPINVQPMAAMPPEVMALLAPAVQAIATETRDNVEAQWRARMDHAGKVMVRVNGRDYQPGVNRIMATVFPQGSAVSGLVLSQSTVDDVEDEDDEDQDEGEPCACDHCNLDSCDGECDPCEDYSCDQCHGACQDSWYSCCNWCEEHSRHHESGGDNYCRHCERCSECEHSCDD